MIGSVPWSAGGGQRAQTADDAEGGVAAVDSGRRIGHVSRRCLPSSPLSLACTQLPMAAEISQSVSELAEERRLSEVNGAV